VPPDGLAAVGGAADVPLDGFGAADVPLDVGSAALPVMWTPHPARLNTALMASKAGPRARRKIIRTSSVRCCLGLPRWPVHRLRVPARLSDLGHTTGVTNRDSAARRAEPGGGELRAAGGGSCLGIWPLP